MQLAKAVMFVYTIFVSKQSVTVMKKEKTCMDTTEGNRVGWLQNRGLSFGCLECKKLKRNFRHTIHGLINCY